MSILVSIITPCLDSEKTIERTVLSVINQNYKNIEYIVIDGNSSDKTLEILHRYQEKDSRIFVVSEKDKSMTEALNRGLKIAKGDIIATINADDWYKLDAINYVVELFKKKQFFCLMADTQFISNTDELLYVAKPWLASSLFAWYLMGCMTPESSVFYSANCIKKIGYFNENLKYTQDFEYYIRIIKNYQISYTNKILSNFCVSPNQYSARLQPQLESEVLNFIDYKFLRKTLGGTSWSTPLRIFLGIRAYTFQQLYKQTFRFMQKNIKFMSYGNQE